MSAIAADRRPSDQPSRSLGVFAGLLLLCVGGGALIGALLAGQAAQYATLDLPSWAPPSGLFGPVWTVLYALMAVSAWLVWRSDHPYRVRTLVAFGVQLAVNFAWTPVFFGLQAREAGMAVILAVLLTAGWWAVEAGRVRRLAGLLQVPYLAWVTFASVLNAAIVAG